VHQVEGARVYALEAFQHIHCYREESQVCRNCHFQDRFVSYDAIEDRGEGDHGDHLRADNVNIETARHPLRPRHAQRKYISYNAADYEAYKSVPEGNKARAEEALEVVGEGKQNLAGVW